MTHRIAAFIVVSVFPYAPVFGFDPVQQALEEDQGKLSTTQPAARVSIMVADAWERPISPYISGSGLFHYDACFKTDLYPPPPGMPTTEDLTREVGVTMLRFSHGSAGQSYFFDHPEWSAQESHFGRGEGLRALEHWWTVDEFIQLCRRLAIEPLLQVNTKTLYDPDLKKTRSWWEITDGDRYDTNLSRQAMRSVEIMADYAAKYVRYVNVEKRYGVKYWEIGNEDYPNPYAYRRIVEVFSEKMRAVDPSIVLIAQYLEPIYGQVGPAENGWKFGYADWETQAYEFAPTIDFLAVHRYWAEVTSLPTPDLLRGTIAGAWGNKETRFVQPIAPVVVTEWNTAGCKTNVFRHTHADALMGASRLNALVRDGVRIGIVHSLVGEGWALLWGAWHPERTWASSAPSENSRIAWSLTPLGWAFKMHNQHRGDRLIKYGRTGPASNYIVTRKGDTVFLIYVNGDANPVTLDLDLRAYARIIGDATLTTLEGKILLGEEYTKWFTAGERRPFEKVDELMRTYPEEIGTSTIAVENGILKSWELSPWTVGYLKVPVKDHAN